MINQKTAMAGMAGLAVLIGPEIAAIRAAPWGAVCMVAAAICVACGAVCMKLHQWATPITVLTGWAVLLGGVPIYVAALITREGPDVYPLSTDALLGTAYNVVIATIFAQWA